MGTVATRGAPRLPKIVYGGDPLSEPAASDLQVILDAFRGRHDAVVALLQHIQGCYGYLPLRALQYAARELAIPLSRIYGVATFYNQFQFSPPGRHVVQICRGTACHVAGSSKLLASAEVSLGIKQDESTPDRLFSLRTVACLGCCSLAPVVVVGRDVHGMLNLEGIGHLLGAYRQRVDEVGA